MTIQELRKELRTLNTRYELNDDYKSEVFINESEELIKSFLKQIQDEVNEEQYMPILPAERINNIFNKYLEY